MWQTFATLCKRHSTKIHSAFVSARLSYPDLDVAYNMELAALRTPAMPISVISET